MSVINRIEVANFLNLDKTDEWQPDWAHVVLDLRGQCAALSIENGEGKSSLTKALLAMMGRYTPFQSYVRSKMAPKATGLSHIRMEVLVQDTARPARIDGLPAAQIPGHPYVFGMFGNSGDGQEIVYYTFEGRLEDCPVARRVGHRIELVTNDEFRRALKAARNALVNPARDEWLEKIAEHFSPANVRQMIEYQIKGAGDGNKFIFEVPQRRGESFGAAVFYEFLAPELLVGVMGREALDDKEWYIEDTIYTSVTQINDALRTCEREKNQLATLDQACRAVEKVALEAASVDYRRNDSAARQRELAAEAAFLADIVREDPLPCLLSTKLPEDARTGSIAATLVLQRGAWLVPDRTLALLTGEAIEVLNQRAERKNVLAVRLERSQAIENPRDLSTERDARGRLNRGYAQDAAINLIGAAPRFAEGWDREVALRAVNVAFDWARAQGDTNPARREEHRLEDEIAALRKQTNADSVRLGEARTEHQRLAKMIAEVDAARAAYAKMQASGLFSDAALADPVKTGEAARDALTRADDAFQDHERKRARLEGAHMRWLAFIERHGRDADPAAEIARLNAAQREAKQRHEQARARAQATEQAASQARAVLDRAAAHARRIEERLDRFARLAPQLAVFAETFADANPTGLERQVLEALGGARRDAARHEKAIAANSAAVAALRRFQAAHSGIAPSAWLAERRAAWEAAKETLRDLEDHKKDAVRRRDALERFSVAAGKVSDAALKRLGSAARALHEVLADIDLAPERRRAVLTHFSGLLFAPVLKGATEAAQAAELLHRNGFEIPVFVEPELVAFARDGALKTADRAVFTYLLGVPTRPVDCLLDPTLVTREKADLDARIADLARAIAQAAAARDTLDPETPEAREAREAARALEAGLATLVESAQAELARLAATLPDLERRASADAIAAIRARVEFDRLGGQAAWTALRAEQAAADRAAADASAALQDCEARRANALEEERTAAQALAQAADSLKAVPVLEIVRDFVAEDGPAFMEAAVSRSRDLAAARAAADARTRFEFDLAAQFLAWSDAKERDLARQFRDLALEIGELEARIEKTTRAIEGHRDRVKGLQVLIERGDAAARTLIERYRKAMALVATPDTLADVGSAALASVPGWSLVASARMAVGTDSFEDLVERVCDIAEETRNLKLDRLESEIAAARRALEEAEARYGKAIDTARVEGRDCFSEVEQVLLESARRNTKAAQQLADSLTRALARKQDIVTKAEESLAERRKSLASRIDTISGSIERNFVLMKNALRWREDAVTGRLEAGFDIQARIRALDELTPLIESIAKFVENKASARQKEIEHVGDLVAQSEAEHARTVKAQIRQMFFRHMFYGDKGREHPEIFVRHPELAAGRPQPFNKEVSTGQGNAVSLLLLIKMAAYAVERGASQARGTLQRRRARRAEQQIMIIDGLFSNLSKEDLIRETMRLLPSIQGSLQLIGLIHLPQYKNDPRVFPTHIVVRRIRKPGGGGYMLVQDGRPVEPDAAGRRAGEMQAMALHVDAVPRGRDALPLSAEPTGTT